MISHDLTGTREIGQMKDDLRFFVYLRPMQTYATSANNSQQCCIRLHGPKSLTGFKLYATSANKCQHCCGSMQTDATNHNIVGPNNVGCCWPTMLGPFAWAFSYPFIHSFVCLFIYISTESHQ